MSKENKPYNPNAARIGQALNLAVNSLISEQKDCFDFNEVQYRSVMFLIMSDKLQSQDVEGMIAELSDKHRKIAMELYDKLRNN